MGIYRTLVREVTDLGPHLRRITVGGPDLIGFLSDGPDQRIKLFLPPPGHAVATVPEFDDASRWFPTLRAIPVESRPIIRTYTIRRVRPELGEVDIDFVLHGDEGPASRWASKARPGEVLAFYGPYADYEPTPGTSWQLIAGDSTALPAIGAILESMPAGTPARVFIENAEEQAFDTVGEVELTWLRPGQSLAEAIRNANLPTGKPYVWIGGEAGSVKATRRHLVNERGVSRSDLYFCGYWRRGASESDAYAAYLD